MTHRLTGAMAMFLAVGLLYASAGLAAEPVNAEVKTVEINAAIPVKAKQKAPLQVSRVHRLKAPAMNITSLRDPFESYLMVLERQRQARKGKMRAGASQRKREPLEAFDLNALKLVAIMEMGGSRVAMVEDDTGKGYVVRKGGYIGRDSGRVVAISDSNMIIMETVLNPADEQVKRKVNMALNAVIQ